ncbi:DUF4468 domain-containing protein [Draconibacterium orientale]|uniref:DUF4468 domain-containing protein n=1 Tax=Draconibacterium orientale TaxID=1168034 RepID=UPI0029BFBECF|nr:DUF4468 domain-containing protein [Draconibacterium orientale]
MKKLLLISIVAIIATSCYTTKSVTFSDDEFVKVYDDVSGTQDQLYLKSNEWLIGIFKNAKSVVQHSDKDEGVILGKYLLTTIPFVDMLTGTSNYTDVFATIDIRLKDNKARLAIQPYDYSYLENSMNKGYNKEGIINEMEAIAEDFHSTLKEKNVDF